MFEDRGLPLEQIAAAQWRVWVHTRAPDVSPKLFAEAEECLREAGLWPWREEHGLEGPEPLLCHALRVTSRCLPPVVQVGA